MDDKGKTYRTRSSLRKRKRNSSDEEIVGPNTQTTLNQPQSAQNLLNEILEGLSVENGEYVRIDENLIKRLKHTEKSLEDPIIDQPQSNPFENFPDFSEAIRDGTDINMDLLEKYSKVFHNDDLGVKMADLLGNFPIELLAMKYSEMKAENWDYNIKVAGTPKVSNQEAAGLCWMHAATNVLRYDIMRKFQVEHRFEISQTYLYFYDKIERSNLFMEYMWQSRHCDIRDFKIHTMSDPDSNSILLSDGGMYSFFSNLVNKYGIVPKNVYGGSMNARSSDTMNKIIMKILVRMTLPLFKDGPNWTREQFNKYKDECMETIYGVVVRFLGEPPKPTDTFDWTYKDVQGETHVVKNLTPEKFYRIVVGDDSTKITIVHDPRHPETHFVSSWVEYGLNMVGKLPTRMINLPLDVFKLVIAESLKNDEAVWFGADIHNGFDDVNKTWDTNRFDYENVLGTPLEFNKSDMLETLVSKPVHAMVFNGVDTVENAEGKTVKYNKWRVFNSWGMGDEEVEHDSGFFKMTDGYFDRYVTLAVVDLKYFEPDEAKMILQNANNGKSFTYKYTDAFGAVAWSGCNHCKSRK